ncbi:MAG: DNA gyrase/topoisomerase IV subunit A [Bacteroidota bacterium]
MSDEKQSNDQPKDSGIKTVALEGMYQTYFLDYASYVILERAVPKVEDGLKPVQRRILHSLKTMDDGRFHKVANVIGQTMAYHPHGDAAIGAALVHMGQKDLLFDCQGNWGDTRTGDPAAAARYIEVRLSKFANEVAFNPKTTEWQLTYDGRKKEPIQLPMKFPLLLSQGADGIAVGLSTKILPHNFIELCKGSIAILKGRKPKLFPDFLDGGMIDITNYNDGKRGGKVRVRARIEQIDKKTLAIKEIPYGTTTGSLIDSILKANDKGKLKVKKVVDNTAADVEILIELPSGVSPDVTIDALYAFSNCEVSISPNACVVIDDKPHFLTVSEILEICTLNTKELLKMELEIELAALREKWHFASLEKIFIEKRIYRDIEECETWEEVLEVIDIGLRKYVDTPFTEVKSKDKFQLQRDITQDDIVKLTEIRIKRISKYNTFKADELIKELEQAIEECLYNLDNLVDYTINYFQMILDKYGKDKGRRTEITEFDTIKATAVVANNEKLYINRKDGFIGYGLKKDEYIMDCSDISDVIVFRKDGKYQVVKIADKVYVGKNIIHAAVWNKGDDRSTYNAVYIDGKTGRTFVKRFNVTAITRDREYDITKGTPNSKLLYFTANPNGESELVQIQLSQSSKARKKIFDYDFSELAIKGRSSQGNLLTKYPVRKVTQLEVGKSTLGAIKIWMDEVSGRLNKEERGVYLGAFDTGDQILAIYRKGEYELTDAEMSNRYEAKDIMYIGKFEPEKVINAVYYEADKKSTYVKRFLIETSKTGQRYGFIGENSRSSLLFVSLHETPKMFFKEKLKSGTKAYELEVADFIDVKGWRSLGNKLGSFKPISIEDRSPKEEPKPEDTETTQPDNKLSIGSEIEFDVKMDKDGQGKMFE